MKKRLFILIFIFTLLTSAFLSACNPATTNTAPTPTATLSPPPTPTPVPIRLGGYLDTIFMYEVNPETAAQQVLDGTIDIYASGLDKQQIAVLEDSTIQQAPSINKQYELLINPVDTSKTAGTLNPFSSSDVRNALNYLIDRTYLVDEVFLGGAVEKYVPLPYGLSDYTAYENTIIQENEKYGYDPIKADDIISTYMTENDCEKNEEGIWTYKNKPVSLIVLIRDDDAKRTQIGDYVCNQLESLGFAVDRQYKNQNLSSTIWAAGDPYQGLWHLYTGRITYDEKTYNSDELFELYYSEQSRLNEIALYSSYTTDDVFRDGAAILSSHTYESLEQRDELFKDLLASCNDYSFRIWLIDELSYTPYSPKLQFDNRLSYKTNTDLQTVFTLQALDTWGGEINWGTNSLLRDAVNPVGGSRAASEKQFLHFTELPAMIENTDSNKKSPILINSVEVLFNSMLSYTQDSAWIGVASIDEIAVPNDAIISWNEEKDAPIYADAEYMHDAVGLATAWLATYERQKPKDRNKIKAQQQVVEDLKVIENRGYITANVKVTVEYDNSIYDLKWHDGSAFSIADIIMSFITKTQLVDKKSALYDPYIAQEIGEEIANFRGFRILTMKPLRIEYYTDSHALLVSDNVKPLWIDYTNGQQNWAMAAVSNTISAQKSANYTYGASLDNESLYLDYLKGASLDLIEETTTLLQEQSHIPYETLLAPYIAKDIAKKQYSSILDFYNEYKHFHIGIGPYMITNLDALTPTVTLQRFDKLTIPASVLVEKILAPQ